MNALPPDGAASYLAEFLPLALVHFLLVVMPGADFVVTVQQSVRGGRRVGVATAWGIGAGISLHVLYTLVGIGALLHALPWLMSAAQLAGAGYLAYLGLSLLRSRGLALDPAEAGMAGSGRESVRRAFMRGFVTNASNPKATLFFLAVFTTMVRPATPLPVQALYGLWMCCVTAGWFALVACAFTHPVLRQRFLRAGPGFERAMGLLLLGFAARLVFVSL